MIPAPPTLVLTLFSRVLPGRVPCDLIYFQTRARINK